MSFTTRRNSGCQEASMEDIFTRGSFLRITLPSDPNFVEYGVFQEYIAGVGAYVSTLFCWRSCVRDGVLPVSCCFQVIDPLCVGEELIPVTDDIENSYSLEDFWLCVIQDIVLNDHSRSIQLLLEQLTLSSRKKRDKVSLVLSNMATRNQSKWQSRGSNKHFGFEQILHWIDRNNDRNKSSDSE